jgi:hypothetical protein
MTEQESTTNIRDWVEEETRHIDVVASWENLCDTYDALRFTDPLSDAERLDEFKWVVQQMNVFLSKIRTKLLSCKDLEAMIEVLGLSYTPAGKMDLSARRSLVYQKLKQQWIRTEITRIKTMMLQEMEMEEQDG